MKEGNGKGNENKRGKFKTAGRKKLRKGNGKEAGNNAGKEK